MRETGPVAYRLSKPSDARYLGIARTLLGVTMNAHQGLPYWRSTTRLVGGGEVTVAWNGDQKYIFISTPETQEEVVTAGSLFVMESGLLVWSEANQDFPVEVWVNQDLAGYFELITDPVPPRTHLESDEADSIPTWSTELPVINDNAYVSENWSNNPLPNDEYIPNPELFTGLMRLALQAKVGAFISPQTIVPTGWGTLNNKADGIIEDPGGDYWVCRLTSSSCTAWPLSVDTDIRSALEAATQPSDRTSESVAKAWDLASLTVQSGEGLGVVLWSQQDNLPGWPLAYGWHYNNAGTQSVEVRVEATIVNDIENWYTGRFYTFTFGFDDVNGSYTPTGSIALTSSGDFVPEDGYSSIWVPEYDDYVLWHAQIWDAEPFEGSKGPIYAHFNAQDELQLFEYTTFSLIVEDGTTPDAGAFLGCDLDKHWERGGIPITTRRRFGGVSVNGGDLAFDVTSVYGATEEHFLTSQTPDSTTTVWDQRRAYDVYLAFSRTMPSYDPYDDKWTSINAGYIGSGDCLPCRDGEAVDELEPFLPRPDLPDNGYPWSRFLKGTVKYRTVEEKVITGKENVETALQALFICATDAEAVILSTASQSTIVSDVSREYHGKFETEVRWQAVWKEYSGSEWNWTGNEYYAYEKTYPLYWRGALGTHAAFCSNSFSVSASPNSSCSWYDSNPDNYGYTEDEEEVVEEGAGATFIGRETIELDAEYDNWEGATTIHIVSDNTRSASWARAMQAWGGGAIVMSGANAATASTAGWPERLVSTQRFIGGA